MIFDKLMDSIKVVNLSLYCSTWLTRLIHQRVRMICHRFYQRILITCVVRKYLQYYFTYINILLFLLPCAPCAYGTMSSPVVSDLPSCQDYGTKSSQVQSYLIYHLIRTSDITICRRNSTSTNKPFRSLRDGAINVDLSPCWSL